MKKVKKEKEKKSLNIFNVLREKSKAKKYEKHNGKIEHQPSWMYRNE